MVYYVAKTRWTGHIARVGERRDLYLMLVGRPERKKPLGRPRRRWKDNIKTDLQEVIWDAWTGSIYLSTGTGGGLL